MRPSYTKHCSYAFEYESYVYGLYHSNSILYVNRESQKVGKSSLAHN